jgi:NAD(P)H-flavin reductase
MVTPRQAERDAGPGPMVPEAFRVRSNVQETDDTWTLELEPANGGSAGPFEPGQFNMLYAFGVGEVPISICGDPSNGGPLLHTVRAVGSVTEAICRCDPGDQLGVRGPDGSSWPVDEAAGGDLVIVAGGLGMAPLRPAVLAAIAGRERFRDVFLLYGGREPEQLLYRGELGRWATEPAIQFGLTVDSAPPEWSGEVGVVTRLIDRAEFDPQRAVGLLCGPEVMLRFAVRALRDRGVPADRIHISMERNMKCALTHCGRCVFGPTYVCREGPVMRFSDVERFFALKEV